MCDRMMGKLTLGQKSIMVLIQQANWKVQAHGKVEANWKVQAHDRVKAVSHRSDTRGQEHQTRVATGTGVSRGRRRSARITRSTTGSRNRTVASRTETDSPGNTESPGKPVSY